MQMGKKIVMPAGSAQHTIGNHMNTTGLLLLHNASDFIVFQLCQLRARQLARHERRARASGRQGEAGSRHDQHETAGIFVLYDA
ncbi:MULTISPECIES: hypothetical protein [Symbiopectobacterium]|uniref:hypothetical protein n=1 Tax=Symbiopectobacterium TaxID=801 RepID=UPI001A33FD95|nr:MULTISPECIES: hypothetical protein [Symbiopectobacterium]MBG6247266.1 hypothetical protein [Candidatus Symbiopectobacterium sp. PLON1]MBT9428336.1 hypothetical protein [Candidatus Symbiopectobacterium endolongispinus]